MKLKNVTSLLLIIVFTAIFTNKAEAQLFETNPSDLRQKSEKFSEPVNDFFNDPKNVEKFLQRFYRDSDKIVGGEDVDIEDYPWQVSVQLQPAYGGSPFCGGTILNEEWILTASHCLVWEDNGDDLFLLPSHIRIRSGFTSMSSGQGSYTNVADIILHPNYNSNSFQFDIALIRLSSPLDLESDTRASVDIVTQHDAGLGMTDPGEMVKVSGWGNLTYQGESPDILQAIEVPIVHVSETSYQPSSITPDMIIAGAPGQDSCQGDSGGPMVVEDGHGWYKVAGVVSFGVNCGHPGYPGVYARVSYFEDWLNQYIAVPDPNQYTTLYYEDFGGGEIPQGWINEVVQGPDGFPGWEWTDTGGDYGGQLNSTTADNGYMILDSDAYGVGGVAEEANLITAPFDLSAVTTSAALSLEHWARTFGNADISIYVSNDDFNTQTELYRWSDGPQNSANGPNPVYSVFDISDVALGESNVKFKFKWLGSYDYWWLIDDVKILVENQPIEVNFVVTDGEEPLAGTLIYTQYANQETITDENGLASLHLYEAEYEIFAEKSGYYPYQTTIQVTEGMPPVDIVMGDIPAPEIAVDPTEINIDVIIGNDAQTELTISNPGTLDLEYSIFAIEQLNKSIAVANPDKKPGKPVTYEGYIVNEPLQAAGNQPYLAHENTQSQPTEKSDLTVEIHHDTDPNSGVGTDAAASFITAARFTAEELSDYYDIYELAAIKFRIGQDLFSEVHVKVWEGGNIAGPIEEIYSAEVTDDVLVAGWTIHQLPESIPFSPGEEYWIGYAIEATGGFPASVDAGPMVPDKGAWMYWSGSWSLLPGLNSDLNFNWNIRGILEPVLGVDWITVNPESGTVEPGNEDVVNVSFDASGPDFEIGEYHADIYIVNNAGETVIVPVTMNIVPANFDVTFVVNDPDGNPVNDAIVMLDGTTNEPGNYVFDNIGPGTYEYTVIKDNFLDVTGNVKVVDQNVFINITMIPDDATTGTLSVHIEDEFGIPLENAYFVLDGFGGFLSDSNGEIEITVIDGQYDYTAAKFGMEEKSGQVVISGEQTSLDLIMDYLRYELTLEALPADGGTVDGADEYYHGETATIFADPAEFYNFSHWSEGTHSVSGDPVYSFEVMGNRHLVANFQIFTYQVTAEAEPSDGGIIDGVGEYDHGAQVTLAAIPHQGYEFVEWTENGEPIEGADELLIFEALANRHLTAHFVLSTYNLTFDVRKHNNQPITDAVIEFQGTVHSEGHYGFEDLLPGTYPYTVSKEGYFDNSGNVVIANQDVTHQVILSIDNTSIDEATAMGISVYPNPASTVLTISSATEIEEVRILDLTGRTLHVSNPRQMSTEVSVNDLYAGIYLLQVTTLEDTAIMKFQKH